MSEITLKEHLENFQARFIATIGTEGSKDGILIQNALSNYEKDWNEPIKKYIELLNCKNSLKLLEKLKDVIYLRDGKVFPVITKTNVHVFDLIDKTNNKKKKSKKGKKEKLLPKFRNYNAFQHHFGHSLYPGVSTASEIKGKKVAKNFSQIVPIQKVVNQPNIANAIQNSKPTTNLRTPKNNAIIQNVSTNVAQNYNSLNKPSTSIFKVPQPSISLCEAEPKIQSLMTLHVVPNLVNTKNKLQEKPTLQPTNNLARSMPITSNRQVYVTCQSQDKLPQSNFASKNIVVIKKQMRQPTSNSNILLESKTPNTVLSSKSKNVFDLPCKTNSLFRFQVLTTSDNKLLKPQTSHNVKLPVRNIVKIIYKAGGTMTLEDLKEKFLEKHNEVLTGSKLAEILDLTCKNHFVAFQSYRPSIFKCVMHDTIDPKIALTKECDELLKLMISNGELSSSTNFVKTNDEKVLTPNTEVKNVASIILDSSKSFMEEENFSLTVQKKKCLEPTTSPLNFTHLDNFFEEALLAELKDDFSDDEFYSSFVSTLSISNNSKSCIKSKRIKQELNKGEQAVNENKSWDLIEAVPFESNFLVKAQKKRPTIAEVKKAIDSIQLSKFPGKKIFFDSNFVNSMIDQNLLYIINKMNYSKKESKKIIVEKFSIAQSFN